MKTKIVYALIASENDLFLEECWTSIYSLRTFHDDAHVVLLVDQNTKQYIEQFEDFCKLITEITVVPVPEEYTAKQKVKRIKDQNETLCRWSYAFS